MTHHDKTAGANKPPTEPCLRLGPVDPRSGLGDPDWWVWCGCPVRGRDGRFHLYASAWPRALPFFNGYVVASRIVHATADTLFAPFRMTGPALPAAPADAWDGRMTHNPAVIEWDGRWWMYYIGGTYAGPTPAAEVLADPAWVRFGAEYRSIRIGCAVADAPDGPWTRHPVPVLTPALMPWETWVVTNPAPFVTRAGRIRVVFRTPRRAPDRVRNVLVVAEAEHPFGPFRLLSTKPLFPPAVHVEDPHVWWDGTRYRMLGKDLDGNTAGVRGGGVAMESDDGVAWRLMQSAVAWTLDLPLQAGGVWRLGHCERPWLVRDPDGAPAALCCAVCDGAHPFVNLTFSRNVLIPVLPPEGRPAASV